MRKIHYYATEQLKAKKSLHLHMENYIGNFLLYLTMLKDQRIYYPIISAHFI